MKYLTREQINDTAWDECIHSSKNGLFYGLSWVLDSLAENWSGIIWEVDGVYKAVFPIPWKRKARIKYVYPPFFIQQLGVFSIDNNVGVLSKLALTLLQSKFRFIELNINYLSELGQSKRNVVLPLNSKYDELLNNYSKNHKRNLKKAKNRSFQCLSETKTEDIVTLFKSNKGAELGVFLQKDYNRFLDFCSKAKLMGLLKTDGVYNGSRLICGGVFIQFKSRLVFLFSGNSEMGKENNALLLLLDNTVKKYAKTGFVLDFEGSESEGLERFYKGFGGVEEDYYFFKCNKLPMIFKWIKR